MSVRKSRRALVAALLALPAVASAVSTRSFVIDTSDVFEKGTVEGAAVLSSGRVVRAQRTTRTVLDGVPVAYASAVGSDGAIYVGTGNEGAVYRLGSKDEQVKLFADTPAALVTSLLWADGTLYAGTLPGGRVYAIDGAGKVRELAQLGTEHVWSLAYASETKTLFAVTGPDGKLFSIDASGRAQLIHDDTAEHLLCVARDREGRLYVGTSNGARLLRITGKQVQVLYDFPGQELTALTLGSDFVAAASNDFPAPAAQNSDNRDLGTAARAKRAKPGNGTLYAVDFNGENVRELARFDGAHISALETAGQDVQVGLGHEGRIVRVSQSGERALWADVDERAIAAVHLSGPSPHFVSSDGVSIYRVKDPAASGRWTSAVLDARAPARFGELAFRAKGALRWSTRSGNTETVDDSWSAWSNELTAAGPIKSPPARFLQLRAELAGDAELYAVEAYYLPQNQAARVRNVRVKPPQDDPNKPRSTTLTLNWDIDNPDEDKLRYRPTVRREGQSAWLPLLREQEQLDHPDYGWDTRSVPDGYYRVRVVVSDEASNPAQYVRAAETISAPILVDNHPPQVAELRAQGTRVTGRARDALGPITQLEFSIDGGPYLPLYPDDDLLDTRDEVFHIDLPTLEAGLHVVAVRVSDAARNVASESIEVSVPTRGERR